MANGEAAPHSSSDDSPDFERPLLHAHGGLQAGKDPAAARDHEAQCSPDAGGATSVRTCFNGLNALSGQSGTEFDFSLVATICLFRTANYST
jgi:vesicular inhibitory amino acid transporter